MTCPRALMAKGQITTTLMISKMHIFMSYIASRVLGPNHALVGQTLSFHCWDF